MPIVAQIVCDGCGTVKKETNHWYTLCTDGRGACLRPLEVARDWETQKSARSSIQYFCGRFCALEAISKWMGTGTESIWTQAVRLSAVGGARR